MRIGLRGKILILLILISLVPLAVLAVLGVYFINLAQQYNVAQLESQLLTQKEKEIEKFIADVETIFSIQIPQSYSALLGVDRGQLELLLIEITRANRYLRSAAFLNYDALYPDDPRNGAELIKVVDGSVVAELGSQSKTAQYERAVGGKIYFGPVVQKETDFVMTVASPVRNRDGMVIGVISGEVSLVPVARIVQDGVLGNSGYLLLTDEKGAIWAQASRLEEQGFESHVFAQSVLSGERTLFVNETTEYISSFGELVVVSAKKLSGLKWVLIAEWPKRDAFALVYSTLQQAGVFLAIILGVVVIASLLFSWRIIKPVRVLERGTRVIGEGNLDYRIHIETKDELQALADRFNEMAKNLKGIEELREVKARVQGLMSSLAKEKELSQIKDAFIATASHQLRTPISVLRWTSESLEGMIGKAAKEDIAAQFSDMSKNIQALSLVIGDILTVAELGIGYKPKSVSEISMLEKVRETISKFTAEAQVKKLDVALVAEDGPWKIKASPLNVSRVLDHLMDNAITYTRESGRIRIELAMLEKEMMVSVKDDGLEVLPDDQKYLFGEFFRGKNSVEMKNVGTGLGLFIVKTIVEGHSGKVGVESPTDWDGKKLGVRFYFTLPLV